MNKQGDDQEFSQILADSINLILARKETMQSILKRYPELANELRPEIEAAIWLTNRSHFVQPAPDFVKTSRQRLVRRLQEDPALVRKPEQRRAGRIDNRARTTPTFVWRLATIFAVLTLLFFSYSGTVYAARDTIPGDGLYGVKRFSEDVTFALTIEPAEKAKLSLAYSDQRLSEVEKLLKRQAGEATDALVQAALVDYEQQVAQTTTLLQQAQVANGEVAAALVNQAQQQNTKAASQLNTMLQGASGNNSAAIKHAMGVAGSETELLKKAVEDHPAVVTKTAVPGAGQATKDTPNGKEPSAATATEKVKNDPKPELTNTPDAPKEKEVKPTATARPENEKQLPQGKPTEKPTAEPKEKPTEKVDNGSGNGGGSDNGGGNNGGGNNDGTDNGGGNDDKPPKEDKK